MRRPARKINVLSCFVLETDSFVEVRDCSIKSFSDKDIFDKALDHYINQKLAQTRRSRSPFAYSEGVGLTDTMTKINETIKKEFVEKMRKKDNEINDYCFVLNFPQASKETEKQYSGLVSLCSTTIAGF